MYKIENKKWFVIFAVVTVAVLAAAFFGWKKYQTSKNNPENQPSVYEAMIQTKGQDKYKTDEDRKTFFENGDVLVIFPEGHIWSNGEKGETIIKLKITKDEAEKLMESETKTADDTPKEEAADGTRNEKQETVRLRKYRVDLSDIDTGKPEKVYDSGAIEKK